MIAYKEIQSLRFMEYIEIVLLFIFAFFTYFLSYFLLFRSKFQTVKAENVFAVMTSLFPLEVKDQKYLKRS